MKVISKNYYLDFIEINANEIHRTPDKFIDDLNKKLEVLSSNERETEKNTLSEKTNKKIIVIHQSKNIKRILEGRSLLSSFLDHWHDKFELMSYKEKNVILAWIITEYQEFIDNSIDLYKAFDLFINIPILSNIEREAILREISEKNPRISFDINSIVAHTNNWEVVNLKQLIKIAILKHFLNSDLNETSNEITPIILNLIESGEFIPDFIPYHVKNGNNNEIFEKLSASKKDPRLNGTYLSPSVRFDDLIKTIQNQGYSEFMLNQLYENAASKNYTEIMLIIDKLKKNEPIEENDRKILARYPFILNDTPGKAHLNLEKAKKRVDLIRLAFGKEQ